MASGRGEALVVTRDTGEGDALPAPTRRVCVVCTTSASKYTCPRCNIPYCGLACYQKHSSRCVEGFYQEQVVQRLQATTASDGERRDMMALLQRFEQQSLDDTATTDALQRAVSTTHAPQHTQGEGEEEDGDDALELLERVARGEASLDALPATVRLEFEQAVAEGKLSHFVEVWEPWWEHSGIAVVGGAPSAVPVPPDTLPALRSLSSKEPSPLLKHTVVDVLAAYVLTMRMFNGDWGDDVVETVWHVHSRCRTLGENALYHSTEEVVVHWKSAEPHIGLAVMSDVVHILQKRASVIRALYHVHAMYDAAPALARARGVAKARRTALARTLRKVWYYVLWAAELRPRELVNMAVKLDALVGIHTLEAKRTMD